MANLETDLQLLQGALDTKCGGDVGMLNRRLNRLESAKEGMRTHRWPMFVEAGNRNLVFDHNTRMIKICEENPDTIIGNIIDDYDVWIEPGAIVTGSFLRGSATTGCHVYPNATVVNSRLTLAKVIRSSIRASSVGGDIFGSTIENTRALGNMTNMVLRNCFVLVTSIQGENHENMDLRWSSRDDKPITADFLAGMLQSEGIILAKESLQ